MNYLLNVYLFLVLLVLSGCASNNPNNMPYRFSDEPSFLVAGQSNSVSGADQHPWMVSKTGLVTINDYYHAPDRMFVPTEADPSMGGVSWIYAGDMLNRKVTFNVVGVGGTNTPMWSDHLYLRIQDALAKNHYDAVLWVQGESDIVNCIEEKDTYAAMKFVIEKSREIQPGITWIIALDSMTGQDEDNHVRRAQKRIILEGLAFQGPDLDYLHNSVTYSGGTAGGGDFIGEGLKEHGRLWYEVLKRGFYEKPH